MKYQIAYLSRTDNSLRVARAVADVLPERERVLSDIEIDASCCGAEVCVLCFDLKNEVCPVAVLNYIEELDGKTLLMIGTSGVDVGEDYRKRLECQIQPFLPEHCRYLGLHLCKGRLTEEELEEIKQKAKKDNREIDAKRLTKVYVESQSHPDMMDIYNVLQFVNDKLGDRKQEDA